jgi:hypothetical protein
MLTSADKPARMARAALPNVAILPYFKGAKQKWKVFARIHFYVSVIWK